jgi:HlyD family secretion protein
MTSSQTISHLILRSAERASRRMRARLLPLALRDAASRLLRVRARQKFLPPRSMQFSVRLVRPCAIAAVVLATGLAGCNEKRDSGFQGWVEADMIFVSPDEAGRVTKLNVREGDEVKVGDHLYSVDDDLQLADLNQNKATLANAQQTYDRAASLSKTGSGTQANLDSAVSALRVAEARVATSETRMTRRKGFAPVAGIIQQIYFRKGEMVGAQRPVLSIMPPGNMKLRFFVPETQLPKLAIGDEVRVACDNCAADLTAKIYFIATTAEYTPPVIYSLDERNKLVYLIQARPSRPDALRVGQPISVYLNPKTPVAVER